MHHTKVFAFDFGINTLLTVVELAVGALTGSAAILADGAQNLTDSLVITVAYICERIAGQPDKTRQSALRIYRRAAGLNASILMILAVLISALAISRTLHPQVLNTSTIIVVGVLSIVINFWAAGMLFATRRDVTVAAPYIGLLFSGLSGAGVLLSGVIAREFGVHQVDGIFGLVIAGLLFVRSGRMLFMALWQPVKLLRQTIE